MIWFITKHLDYTNNDLHEIKPMNDVKNKRVEK